MSYQHLTLEERYQIWAGLRSGESLRSIAKELHRCAASVSREVRRNRHKRGYRPAMAQMLADRRSQEAHGQSRIQASQWQGITDLIRLDWSPEQISQRARVEGTLSISTPWIYQYIATDKAQGGELWRHLRCQKRRRRYGTKRKRKSLIRHRIGIEERPPSVETRDELGHWEGDTIVGSNNKSCALTLVERRSRFLRLGRLAGKDARALASVCRNRLHQLSSRVLTITVDNGSEFAFHGKIARALSAQVYFADPYAPWQRGTNENTNGLIRQYLPKKTALNELTEAQVSRIENRLNRRPRKCLGFLTPHEVFNDTQLKLTVALRS